MSSHVPDSSRPKPRRVKRKNIQVSDGWTIITHAEHKGNGGGGNQDEFLRHAQTTSIVQGLTVAKLLDDFKSLGRKWKETTCAKRVDEVLGKRRRWGVKEGVCIGIGSFSLDWEHRHRSMWQLVLFMHVVDMLRRDGAALQLYAQELIFTSLDEAFLAALDVTVLAADIEAHVTDSSFVFAPFVEWNLLLSVFLKDRNPDLYVGNEILDDYRPYANTEDKREVVHKCDELGRVFLEQRTGMRVPDFDLHAHALNGLFVYWKITKEEDG